MGPPSDPQFSLIRGRLPSEASPPGPLSTSWRGGTQRSRIADLEGFRSLGPPSPRRGEGPRGGLRRADATGGKRAWNTAPPGHRLCSPVGIPWALFARIENDPDIFRDNKNPSRRTSGPGGLRASLAGRGGRGVPLPTAGQDRA